MKNPFLELIRIILLVLVLGAWVRDVEAQVVRSPLVSRPAIVREKLAKRPSDKISEPTTIRYSSSAEAWNMLTPAILLGAPSIVILALVIKAMKGD
jgi:hypothetical protein